MILERGDMWSVFGKTDLFLITTNPIMRKDGAVVMGRGIAKQVADKFPGLPWDFGRYLQQFSVLHRRPYTGNLGMYGGQDIGFFMVKDHWREPAQLSIIEQSVQSMLNAMHYRGIPGGIPPRLRWDLNFPGIGNGKLKREDVLPLIEKLPDNVHVWEYG